MSSTDLLQRRRRNKPRVPITAAQWQRYPYRQLLRLLLILLIALPQMALAQSGVSDVVDTPQQPTDALDIDALIEARTPPPVTVVRTIDTSSFSTPSSDPSGLEFVRQPNRLLIADSEIDELPIFAGANLFYTNISGTLTLTGTTTSFSPEPTGLALNRTNGHLYISDDGKDRIYEMQGPGLDGIYGTNDEITTAFLTSNFGSLDPEGLDFATIGGIETLFLVDGTNDMLYTLQPGLNGIFNGGGDDVITSFDTEGLGITSMEGVAYSETTGTLFIAGTPKVRLAEVTLTGELIRLIDTSPASPEKPSGLTFGRGANPNLYLADRRVDNANDGKVYELQLPTVTVGNQQPMVDAGPNQVVNLPNQSTILAGVVTDDGVPSLALTHKWTVFKSRSVTPTVTFVDNDILNTGVTFPQTGTYVLRLTADDNELAAVDFVTVTVNAPPVVDAGLNQTVSAIAGATLDGTVTDDGLPNPPGVITTTWSLLSGPGAVTITNPSAVDTTASFVAGGMYLFNLSANDGGAIISDTVTITVTGATNQAPLVDAGPKQTIALTETAALTGSVNDDGLPVSGTLVVTWSVASGPMTGTVTFGDINAAATTASFPVEGTYILQLDAADGELTSTDQTTVTVASAANQPPVVNAGIDQLVSLLDGATLQATVTDDGQPSGQQLTVTWRKISGPGDVTFGDPNNINTTVTFSAPGTYILALNADDGDVSVDDLIEITVNAPPTVEAGAPQEIELNGTAQLDGTVNDDGRPEPATVTTTWSQVSGPGSATFGDANAVDTTVTFDQPGEYVLQLTAGDGQLTVNDTVTVTVAAPNTAPTITVGGSQTVTVGSNVNLSANVTDDGLPTPAVITTTWSKASGPGDVIFGAPNIVNTTAIFSAVGTYVLRLTADDGELETSVTIQIVVQEAGERKLFLPVIVNQ